MAKLTANDIKTNVTNAIIAQLEDSTSLGAWVCPWNRAGLGGMPTRSNGEYYKGVNVIILMMAGFGNPNWMTYKQAEALGGQVRKGEKGTMIVFYKPLTIKDKATGDEKRIPMLKTYNVFNADQIDNLPAKFHPAPATKVEGKQRIAHVDDFVVNTGATINVAGQSAFYRPATDEITMPDFDLFHTTEDYYSTELHELVHWTKAKARCDRDLGRDQTGYAKEELVAELGSAFLMAMLGMESQPRQDHAQYLASWLQVLKADNDAIFKAASKASAAAQYLQDLQVTDAQEIAA